MMGNVGLIGFAVAAMFLSFAFPTLLGAFGIDLPAVGGYSGNRLLGFFLGALIWVVFAGYSGFSPGSLLLGCLYLLHALVGYVELGTDSWINNITARVLKSQTNADIAFVWTNLLMFTLRFTAGPIVHRINPIGLLLISAIFGTVGLALLGLPLTDTVWPWIGAVSIYGVGKTFYWPTLLGVISERFPKGGALAIGLSGGIGMISAGFFGVPGIGYKQDYLAVQKLQESSPETYARYKSAKEDGFPILSEVAPTAAPPIAGLDNGKLKVFDDFKANGDSKKTTLESDLATLEKEKSDGKPVGEKLEQTLRAQKAWWDADGKPNFAADKDRLDAARDYGAKTALLYTAAVPAALAVGFLLLLLYFSATGGYKQVHIGHDAR